jgi:hypothetical protein
LRTFDLKTASIFSKASKKSGWIATPNSRLCIKFAPFALRDTVGVHLLQRFDDWFIAIEREMRKDNPAKDNDGKESMVNYVLEDAGIS